MATATHLRRAFWAFRVSTSITYGAFAVLLWDALLTLADEVKLIWPARFTIVKGLYLFNRYISPPVVAVNMWMFSGHARNISDLVCRAWLTIAFIIQMLGFSCVSLVVAIRLRAFYEATRKTLLFLLLVWALSLASQIGLMSRNFFAVMHTYRFSRVVNMCVGESPSPWQNWIPYALEHGVFCAFLFIKALKTPRSSQTPLLAIMYKQGILYFAVTFVFFFASLLLWRFGSSEWFYLPLFTTWILCQIAMSRLLLSVKSSQVFHQSFPPRSDSPHANANANANHSALARSLSPGIFPPGFSAAALHCANGRYDTVRRDSRIEIIHRGGGGAGSRRESAIPLASILRPVVDGRGNSTGGAGGAGEDGEGAYTLDDLGHRRNDSSTHDEDGSHPPKDLIYKDVDVDGVSLTMGTNGKLPCRVTTSAGPGGGGVGGFFERMMDRLSYGLPWWFTRRPYGDLHIEVTTNQEEEEEMEMVGDGVVAVMEDGGGERDPSGLRTRAVDAIGTEENLIGSGGSIRTAIARQQQTLAAAAAAAAGDRGRGRGRGGLRVSRLGRYDQWL